MKFINPCSATLGLFALTACTFHTVQSAPMQSAPVPFELYKGHIFVSAYVNREGPYRFGFDTGASGMGRADTALAAELDLPKVDETLNSDGVTESVTNVVMVKRLRVGALEKSNVRLLSRNYNKNHRRDQPRMMGIIAREFFSDRLVTINYPARTIAFTTDELHQGDPGVVAYGDSFAIPVCVAGECYSGKVDTGSSRGLVFPESIAKGLPASAPVVIGQVARTNSAATLYSLVSHAPVRVGGVTVDEPMIYYATPSTTTINIGSDFLKDYVLTIDPRHRLLRLAKPGGSQGAVQ